MCAWWLFFWFLVFGFWAACVVAVCGGQNGFGFWAVCVVAVCGGQYGLVFGFWVVFVVLVFWVVCCGLCVVVAVCGFWFLVFGLCVWWAERFLVCCVCVVDGTVVCFLCFRFLGSLHDVVCLCVRERVRAWCECGGE